MGERLIRSWACLGLSMFMSACLEQYRPEAYLAQLKRERVVAGQAGLKLKPDGTLPEIKPKKGPGQGFDAATVYQTNCVACHGADGAGNIAMNARNFKDKVWQSIAKDEEIAAIILYGAMGAADHAPSLKERTQFKLQYPTMIAWAHLFDADVKKRDEQLASLVAIIRGFGAEAASKK